MASTQKATVYHVLKTNKSGSKVAVSSHRGAEVTTSTPQRGHGYVSSSQRGPAVSLSPSQRRPEAATLTTHCSVADYPRSLSPQPGPGPSTVSTSRGTETRPRTETSRPRSPHRKNQSVQTLSSHLSGGCRNVSPMREESTRRYENKPGLEVGYHSSLASDAKYRHLSFVSEKEEDPPSKVQKPHHLSFVSEKEEDPPSKVQKPQGVKVPHPLESYFEMDSNLFCEDLMFQRERGSLPPSPKESLHRVPLLDVPKTPKHTSKHPIQGFNAFFLGTCSSKRSGGSPHVVKWDVGIGMKAPPRHPGPQGCLPATAKLLLFLSSVLHALAASFSELHASDISASG
ncbi:hypothetical protein ACRRTK_007356 [Alexandromys fortis]